MKIEKKWKSKIIDYCTSFSFILPVMLGIIIFTLIPLVSSFYYSFFDYYSYEPKPTNFVGFQNYIDAFTKNWDIVGKSLGVTFVYTLISVPLNLVLSFLLALLLNKSIRGIKFFRAFYYSPVIIPAVVSGFLWKEITDPKIGSLNYILTEFLHLPPYTFYSSPDTVLPTLLFMSLFGLGGNMVLWIAQLKSIPTQYFEVAQLEGAGYFVRLIKIIIPMCTPMIFYNLLTGIIGGLQVFTQMFLIRTPINSESLTFFVIHIYDTAITGNQIGYGSALSWILFVIIATISFIIFKTSKWVFYGENV